jgi:branched-chain amino acid transport system permease protein
MTFFFQNLVNAISLGSLYALFALGIALIFGIMGLVNFAHGELVMVGGYVLSVLTFKVSGVPAPVWILAVLLVVAAVAVLMERVAFRPIRKAPASTLLIASFAVSYLLQHVALAIFGGLPVSIIYPPFVTETTEVSSLVISKLDIATIVLTAALLAGLAAFLKMTPIGVQMRAAAEDFETARLMGVRANKVIAVAFLLSGILAAMVSIIYLAKVGTVVPTIGISPVLVGLVAVVVGGLGSLRGAALGGFVLGLVTIMTQAYLPAEVVPFRDAFVFGTAILILLVRPEGLLVAQSRAQRV